MSGSEFALRIALCDVVEKWKRSQEKCKYLEQCRNELAKELIRVKQVNEDLVKENSVLAASLTESGASMDKMTPNRSEEGRPRVNLQSPMAPADRLVVQADRLVVQAEEDVEQIERRLLQEMHENVAKAGRKSPPCFSMQEPDKQALIDDEAAVAPGDNSVASELVIGNQPNCSAGAARDRQQRIEWNRRAADAHSQRPSSSPDPCTGRLPHPLHARDGAIRVVVRTASESGVKEQGSGDGVADGEPDMSHVYAKVMAVLTADLNQATQHIQSQKEKLKKLKSRQLRSYFRRQLKGEDQSSSTGNIPNPSGSRCHLEHTLEHV